MSPTTRIVSEIVSDLLMCRDHLRARAPTVGSLVVRSSISRGAVNETTRGSDSSRTSSKAIGKRLNGFARHRADVLEDVHDAKRQVQNETDADRYSRQHREVPTHTKRPPCYPTAEPSSKPPSLKANHDRCPVPECRSLKTRASRDGRSVIYRRCEMCDHQWSTPKPHDDVASQN